MNTIITSEDYKVLEITGAGGKGGGGGSQPYEAPNTLRSRQTIDVLFAIGEGEITDVEEIYANSVPIAAYNSYYYHTIPGYRTDVVWDWRPGIAGQAVIDGFSDIEAPIAGAGSFPVPLTHWVGGIPGNPAPIYEYSVDPGVDAVRVILQLQALEHINSSGDRLGSSVSFTLLVGIYSGGSSIITSWSPQVYSEKAGKATAPYAWDVLVTRPSGVASTDRWGIKVVRDTDDATTDMDMNSSYIQQLIGIKYSAKTYDYTALIGVVLNNAAQFGGNIPDLRFRIKGLKFFLPINYDPTTPGGGYAGTYTGAWTGGWKSFTEYTPNLAWFIYNVFTNTRWGMKIPTNLIDVGSFYNYAKHCDFLVSNGSTGTEPRYSIHYQFATREQTATFLMFLQNLGNCNFSTNEYGQIKIIWDGAGQAVKHVESNATVTGGEFNYSSNDLESRFTSINVTFNDPALLGDTNTLTWPPEPEVDSIADALQVRYGLQSTDIVLKGCYSEAQALRKAKWAIWTNSVDVTIVTYKKLFGGAYYAVGDLVDIMDSENVDITSRHAMLKSYSVTGSVTTLVLDRTISLPATLNNSFGVSVAVAHVKIEMLLKAADGSTPFYECEINEVAGDYSVITVNAVIDAPFTGTTVVFKHLDAGLNTLLAPMRFKITKVELEDHVYTITALIHSEAKYAYIEDIGTIVKPDDTSSFVNFKAFTVPAPTSLVVTQSFSNNGIITKAYLHCSWNWNLDNATPYAATFKLIYSRDNTASITVQDIHVAGFDIQDPVPGTYVISVWAVNPFNNLLSEVISTTYAYRIAEGVGTSTLNPPINLYVAGTTGGIFNNRDCVLTWEFPPSNIAGATSGAYVPDSLRDYLLEIRDYTTGDLKNTYVVPYNGDTAFGTDFSGRFTYHFTENFKDFAGTPARQFRVKVYCRDAVGGLSDPIELICSNPVPNHSNFTVTLVNSAGSEYFYINQTTLEPDIQGYIIWKATSIPTSGTTGATAIDVGLNFTPSIAETANYYYAISAYDNFDKNNPDLSSWVYGTPTTFDPATYTYVGLTFTPNSPGANQISWPAFDVIRNGSATVTIATGNLTWTTGSLYIGINDTHGDGSAYTMEHSTTLATAVGWTQILATYKGGINLASGDGSAFIDGGQVITRSLAANALIGHSITADEITTGSAVITGTLQVADGILTTAKIKNFIESADYSTTFYTGWHLDTNNDGAGSSVFNMYAGAFNLYDNSGGLIFSASNKFDGAYIKDATVDTAQIKYAAIKTANVDIAAITTLTVQGNAVTVSSYNTAYSGATASASISVASGVVAQSALIIAVDSASGTSGVWMDTIYHNGSSIGSMQVSGLYDFSGGTLIETPGIFMATVGSLGAGTHTFSCTSNSSQVSIIVLLTLR